MRSKQFFKNLMTIIITAVVTFSITMLWVYGRKGNQEITSVLGNAFASDTLVTKLNLIKNKIQSEYIGEEVSEDELLEGVVKGYVAALGDEYTKYFPKKEMEEYYSDTVGEFVGIGVQITLDKELNEIVVFDTYKDSPAEKAGIKSGDVIIEVDGTPCSGDDYDTITDSIKGKIGTTVKIKVKRKSNQESAGTNEKTNNQEEIIEFEVKRASVDIIRVSSQMLENNIGYIYISSFDGTKVAEQFETEYDNLLNQGMKALIVDIRTNGGGIVDEAIDIADLFIERGNKILVAKNKTGNEEITSAKKDKKITMKTALLVNQYSASASEILAGALKDLANNVTIIGATTYGKGVIQTLYELSDGSGLKITTEEYYTPNGNEINKKGIEPKIEVKDQSIFLGDLDQENDKSIQKAIEILKESQNYIEK